MIYTNLTKLAMKIAFDAHKDQVDIAGLPYVFHPFYLASQMDDEDSTCIALLHDVVEDSNITFDNLEDVGFHDIVIKALALLTHDDEVPYLDYIQKIKDSHNRLAIKVKLLDLMHNSDISRLNYINDEALNRIEKYNEAIKILQEEDLSL